MTQGISGYRDRSTDDLLARAEEAAGDYDPSRFLADTGKPLHFDATVGLEVHREGLQPTDGGALKTGAAVLSGKVAGAVAYDVATGALSKQMLSPLLRAGAGAALEGLSAVATLGTLYDEAVEGPSHEADRQRALGASDAGVVGMAQALDLDPAFQAVVARAHPGSGNAAAAVRVQIDADPAMKGELQLRADRGFVDAAGYAKLAAHAMLPMYREAAARLSAARIAEPEDGARLRGEAQALMAQAATAEKRYLAPVMGKAQGDAAYGIGVQYALHQALRAESSGTSDAFDAAFSKANENARGWEPAALRIGG